MVISTTAPSTTFFRSTNKLLNEEANRAVFFCSCFCLGFVVCLVVDEYKKKKKKKRSLYASGVCAGASDGTASAGGFSLDFEDEDFEDDLEDEDLEERDDEDLEDFEDDDDEEEDEDRVLPSSLLRRSRSRWCFDLRFFFVRSPDLPDDLPVKLDG